MPRTNGLKKCVDFHLSTTIVLGLHIEWLDLPQFILDMETFMEHGHNSGHRKQTNISRYLLFKTSLYLNILSL